MIQTSMKELTKERLAIRKDNPIKANVLLMLVSFVKDLTIEEHRSETPADFGKAAKKLYNEVQNTILEYKKGNADTSELEQQLKEIEPFLPDTLSMEVMEETVKKIISELPETERNLKNIMPKLKSIDGFDMKAAKSLIDKILSK